MVDLPLRVWITAGTVFLAVGLATVSLTLFVEWLADRRRRRGLVHQLERLDQDLTDAAAGGSVFRQAGGVKGWAATLGSRSAHLQNVELLIEQSAIHWTTQTYMILSVGFGVALGMFTTVVGFHPVIIVVAAISGASLPYLYLKHKRAKRMAAFEENLPEAIDLLGRAIRAGHPLTSGLKMVAEEAPDPIGPEFRRVFEELRFGLSFEDSMLGMADRIPLVDVRIFVTAVMIQREVGGNLAEILDKLSYVIRQRFSILRQLRTYTAQGRMSGYILGGLPIFLALVLFMLNPENMTSFVQHPFGRMMVGIAVTLQIFGYLWINKIVKIEV